MNYLQLALQLFISSVFAIGLAIGCSPVGFEAIPPEQCNDETLTCVVKSGVVDYEQVYKVDEEKLDVLVVNDSSASMLPEQTKKGDRFNYFLSAINGLDWQLAITTMDISNQYRDLPLSGTESDNTNSWDIPGKEAYYDYQDGRLIPLYGSTRILTRATPNAESIFREKIKIPSSVTSDGDERGIFTAALALQNNNGNLVRKGSHIAIIFLTDEDVRGKGIDQNYEGDKMREQDFPQHLINTLRNTYGATKGLSVHPIIIRPGDTACLGSQDKYGGEYGHQYKALMDETGGNMGSICDNDYSNLLADIGNDIRDRVTENIPLACNPLQDGEHQIEILGADAASVSSFRVDGKNLVLEPALPYGAEIQIKYSCNLINSN